MAKVITFSRQFPSYHPRKGEPTYFVEKVLPVLSGQDFFRESFFRELLSLNKDCPIGMLSEFVSSLTDVGGFKHHTIRAGHRFKAGDFFSPRVWSGKPDNSKQIIIAPDIRIKRVFPIEMYIKSSTGYTQLYIYGGREEFRHMVKNMDGTVAKIEDYRFCGSVFHRDNTTQPLYTELANNDGLSVPDFADWFLLSPELDKGNFNVFDKRFVGQIICWNEKIEY